METIGFDTDHQALEAARAALVTLASLTAEVGGETAERAAAIARVVAHFEPDRVAVEGTALHALLRGAPRRDDPRLALLDPEALDFAAALARLDRTDLPARGLAGRYTAAQAEGLRRMLLAVVADPRLVLARLAEQWWRLREAREADADTRQRLGQETLDLYAPLANRLGLAALKWELEDSAFRYLEPLEYRRIADALAEKRADRERYIEALKTDLEGALREAGLVAAVTGRPKHLYSIYRKMRKKDLQFAELSDVRAVRILVGTVAECYAALGVVHGRYAYLPGEFDDYVATPKVNGYRSIHTAVTGPGGRTVEVQIRTREMHERAESGVAAHWRYKEGGRRDDALERKVEELRRLLNPAAGDDDPLAVVQRDLFRERVYVFSPRGDVVEVPEGSTPLDFAYHVHTGLGHRCRGARVDGRLVPLDHRLTHGVTVEIVAAREPQPSRDWLIDSRGFLASKSAKAKVRAWFRQVDRDAHLARGRDIADRELGRRGAATDLAALASLLGVAGAEELYVGLGSGDLSAAQLAAAQARRERTQGSPAIPAAASGTGTPRPADDIHVMGVGDLLSHHARCCNPVPPEPVTGYVTLGRGITLHRSTCRNLRRLAAVAPDRLVPVSWGEARKADYAIEFQVRAFDRRGLVRDVSAVLADARLSIDHMKTVTSPEGTADMRVGIRVRDLDDLERCLARIRGLPDVIRAQRA